MPRPMVTKLLRNRWAPSSVLTVLGKLQPTALGFLNSLVTLVLASNYYLENPKAFAIPILTVAIWLM